MEAFDMNEWKKRGLSQLEEAKARKDELEIELGTVESTISELTRMLCPDELTEEEESPAPRKRMRIRPAIVRMYEENKGKDGFMEVSDLIEKTMEELGEGARITSVSTSVRRFAESGGRVIENGVICVEKSENESE
jgi:hypothetical protein